VILLPGEAGKLLRGPLRRPIVKNQSIQLPFWNDESEKGKNKNIMEKQYSNAGLEDFGKLFSLIFGVTELIMH